MRLHEAVLALGKELLVGATITVLDAWPEAVEGLPEAHRRALCPPPVARLDAGLGVFLMAGSSYCRPLFEALQRGAADAVERAADDHALAMALNAEEDTRRVFFLSGFETGTHRTPRDRKKIARLTAWSEAVHAQLADTVSKRCAGARARGLMRDIPTTVCFATLGK